MSLRLGLRPYDPAAATRERLQRLAAAVDLERAGVAVFGMPDDKPDPNDNVIGAAALGVLIGEPNIWKAWLSLPKDEQLRMAREAGKAARKAMASLNVAPPKAGP